MRVFCMGELSEADMRQSYLGGRWGARRGVTQNPWPASQSRDGTEVAMRFEASSLGFGRRRSACQSGLQSYAVSAMIRSTTSCRNSGERLAK